MEKTFIKTKYGELINLNKISRIGIKQEENNLVKVFAKKGEQEITLYSDVELQNCEQFLADLSKKIAICMW